MSGSDSEDDQEYVPPVEDRAYYALDISIPILPKESLANSSSSSDDENEPDAKRTRPNPNPEDEAAKNVSRENAWKDFQASMTTETSKDEDTTPKKMVSVEKRYLFAGEEVVLFKSPKILQTRRNGLGGHRPDESGQTAQSVPEPPAEDALSSAAGKPPPKRPGPRKSKIQLSATPSSSKLKKITMLEKSAMDWRSHVGSPGDSELKDELEANRRGGGYLEKVEFLERVQERKEEVLEHNKGTKRRRT
ncbi:hypothetical protein AAF712_012489 [Marasmius tenuissimus]|uniref:SWR1-complex protein 5 n=1 Tax=Marasmius tenuissimus TaxID=585030 RepID=A0ABR2ZHM0_9AGAR